MINTTPSGIEQAFFSGLLFSTPSLRIFQQKDRSLMLLDVLETEARYVCIPPPGKPDPRVPYKAGEGDKCPRVPQSLQKGSNCTFYAANLIRERIGKAFPPEYAAKRKSEIFMSTYRKKNPFKIIKCFSRNRKADD